MDEERSSLAPFEERLNSLSTSERQAVYLQLWLELTIAGRVVAEDPDLDDLGRLEGLKWLNEIQHRVWGAHRDPGGKLPAHLIASIKAAVEQAPRLNRYVEAALQSAFKKTTRE